jgi:hypothetical protein
MTLYLISRECCIYRHASYRNPSLTAFALMPCRQVVLMKIFFSKPDYGSSSNVKVSSYVWTDNVHVVANFALSRFLTPSTILSHLSLGIGYPMGGAAIPAKGRGSTGGREAPASREGRGEP